MEPLIWEIVVVRQFNTRSRVYKILGTDENLQRITLADRITYKIASTLRSEQGLYAVPMIMEHLIFPWRCFK